MASECEIFDNLVYRLVHYKRQEDVLALAYNPQRSRQ